MKAIGRDELEAIRVDVYELGAGAGDRPLCRSSTLGDCFPGDQLRQAIAGRYIRAGRSYDTDVATLRPAQ